MSSLRRWLNMTLLCFSGGIIFMLPFLRQVYYLPMQETFGYDNTQMGILVSVFGLVSLVTYFPGGWLADRVQPRKLMSAALLFTGLGGLYLANIPSYLESVLIHALWGFCTSLIFWSAMIKATRNWASSDDQGKAFGILESGRGIAEAGSSTLFLSIFALFASAADGLIQVIYLFAFTNMTLAILVWLFFLESNKPLNPSKSTRSKNVGWQEVKQVLVLPEVWLISVILLASYSAYWGSYYFAPYSSEVFMLSAILGGAVNVANMWLKPLTAIAAGFFADQMGVAKAVFGFFVLMTVGFFIFALLPSDTSFLVPMLINTAIVSITIFAVRGIYWALLDEGGIPVALTGTAAGVISVVGFTPDIFMPALGGWLLDTYPGAQGYQYFYLVIATMCLFGCIAAWLISKRIAVRQHVV